MKTEHIIRVRTTHEVVYQGTSLDDCKQVMKPAFMDHISKGYLMEDFPLEAITLHSLEESEMDTEEDYYDPDFDYTDPDEDDLPF